MSDANDTTDQDAIERQQKLLAAHRERLAILLAQHAHFGAHVPPHILTGIREAQEALRPIKAWLRAAGVPIEDEPNDEAQTVIKPSQTHQPDQNVNQTINNPAPNQDAQGIFYESVSFHQAGSSSPAAPPSRCPTPRARSLSVANTS